MTCLLFHVTVEEHSVDLNEVFVAVEKSLSHGFLSGWLETGSLQLASGLLLVSSLREVSISREESALRCSVARTVHADAGVQIESLET